MPKKKVIKIDGESLRRLYQGYLKDHKMSAVDFCGGMGFLGQYVTNCCLSGSISQTAVIMLERLYGIKPEEYEYHEPAPVPVPTSEPEQVTFEAVEKVRETVGAMLKNDYFRMNYKCTHKAVEKALAECAPMLEQMVYKAMHDALTDVFGNNDGGGR